MEDETKNIGEVCLAIIASLCYTYFISSKITKGKPRLLSLLPIFSLFAVLPLHFTSAFLTFFTAFFITSLANFKLLLFAFALGPLSSQPLKPFPIFAVLACLPVRNLDTSSSKFTKQKKINLNLPTQVILFSNLVAVLSKYGGSMNPKIALGVYCILIYLLVDLVMSLSNMMALALVGLELEPPSNEPYLSSSLQDFWGKRWNLIVTNTLRNSVYKPVRAKSAQLPATIAAFLVSGLMHELVLYYVTRASPTWEMTGFFVLHGVCVAAEVALKRAVGARWQVPLVVAAPSTVGFVVVTSSWLFFPAAMKSGAVARFVDEINFCVDYTKSSLKLTTAL